MEKKLTSEVLDNILDKIENPNIAVVGPGLNEDLMICDASLFYYLNRLYNRRGKLSIIDKYDFFIKYYKKDILCQRFPMTKNIEYLIEDITAKNNSVKRKFDIISYHCSVPFISATEEGIKKVINSSYCLLKENGKAIFMSFCGESEYMLHKLFSQTTKILRSLLLSDKRFKVEDFNIEDSYVAYNGTQKETIWPYYACNTMTIATKLK